MYLSGFNAERRVGFGSIGDGDWDRGRVGGGKMVLSEEAGVWAGSGLVTIVILYELRSLFSLPDDRMRVAMGVGRRDTRGLVRTYLQGDQQGSA